jgi:hypothetical protein
MFKKILSKSFFPQNLLTSAPLNHIPLLLRTMSEFKINNRQAAEEDLENRRRLDAIQKSLDTLSQQQTLLLTTQQTTLDKVNQVHDQVSIHTDILHRLVRDRSNEVWILRGLLLMFFGVVVLKIIF